MRKLTVALAAGLVTVMAGMAFGADKVTITGEVIDTYCYSTAGAKGEGHRSCGLACAKKGIPVALLEKGTDKVYVLLPNKQAAAVPKAAIDKMGRQATITGSVYTVGGSQFLTVESVK